LRNYGDGNGSIAFFIARHGTIHLTATDSGNLMSGIKRARAKPSIVPRFVTETEARGDAASRPVERAPAKSDVAHSERAEATPTESVAASIVSLMLLAADAPRRRVPIGIGATIAARDALARIIAARLSDDE
jgi:hypothetical protein